VLLHKEQLHNFFLYQNITTFMYSRRAIWATHEELTGTWETTTNY